MQQGTPHHPAEALKHDAIVSEKPAYRYRYRWRVVVLVFTDTTVAIVTVAIVTIAITIASIAITARTATSAATRTSNRSSRKSDGAQKSFVVADAVANANANTKCKDICNGLVVFPCLSSPGRGSSVSLRSIVVFSATVVVSLVGCRFEACFGIGLIILIGFSPPPLSASGIIVVIIVFIIVLVASRTRSRRKYCVLTVESALRLRNVITKVAVVVSHVVIALGDLSRIVWR